jgi:hypothetical protein
MMKRRLGVAAVVGIAAIAAWMLIGCGGSSGGGTGQIQISLVDAPLAADAVYVDIASVQVHSAGDGWITLKEYSPALHVDLLQYSTGGESLMLADCPLGAGHYTMVRLMLTAAEVVVGGQPHQVDLQNVEQTGVKCNGQFTVEEGGLMALILDFNAERSFVATGSGDYMLHPVMSMSPVNVAATVTGSVQFQGGSGTPPFSTVINLYTPGHVGEADFLVASTSLGADGAFTFDVVAQGTYDLEVAYVLVEGGETLSYVQQNVQVVAPQTALDPIVIQLL